MPPKPKEASVEFRVLVEGLNFPAPGGLVDERGRLIEKRVERGDILREGDIDTKHLEACLEAGYVEAL